MSNFAELTSLLVLLVAGGLSAYRWPIIGVYAIVVLEAFDPLREPIHLLGGLSAPKALGLGLVGIGFVNVLMGKIPLAALKTPLWLPVIGFLSLFGLYIVGGVHAGDTADAFMDIVSAIILFGLLLLFRHQLSLDWLARLISGCFALVCVLQFFIDTGNIENGRPSGFSQDPNIFALLLVIVLPLTVFLAVRESGRALKALWIIGALLQLHALADSLSRSGALVAVFVALVGLAVSWRSLSRIQIARMAGAAALGMILFAAFMPQEYLARLASLSEVSFSGAANDRSLGRRAAYWTVAGRMIQESPVFGQGPGSYPEAFAKSEFVSAFSSRLEEESYFRRAHNTYLEVSAEMGLVGLGIWLLIIGSGSALFWRARRLTIESEQTDAFWIVNVYFLSFTAAAAGLFFLSAPDQKVLWSLLAVSGIIFDRVSFKSGMGIQ